VKAGFKLLVQFRNKIYAFRGHLNPGRAKTTFYSISGGSDIRPGSAVKGNFIARQDF
jgi:hypothetical protein